MKHCDNLCDDDKNKCGCIEKIDFENKDLDEKKT